LDETKAVYVRTVMELSHICVLSVHTSELEEVM